MKKILTISWYVIGLWTGFTLLNQFVISPNDYQKDFYPTTIVFAIIFSTFLLWLILGYIKKKISA